MEPVLETVTRNLCVTGGRPRTKNVKTKKTKLHGLSKAPFHYILFSHFGEK